MPTGRVRAALAVVAAVATVGVTACSGEESGPPSSTGPGTTTAPGDPTGTGPLDYPAYRDPAQPIYAALGRRFAVRLEAQPGAGFSWELSNTPDPAVVIPIGTEFRGETTGTAVGVTAVQYLSFAASGTGTTTIEVRYVSPTGEPAPDTPPLRFTVTVTFTGEPPPPPPESGTTQPID
jgi:predicted secreted protein